jgi:hypothetical protein
VVYIDTSAPENRMGGTRELRNLNQLGKKIRFQAFLLFFQAVLLKLKVMSNFAASFIEFTL